MLNNQDQTHGPLSQSDNPLSGLWHPGACVLSTNIQEDRTCIGNKIVIDNPVSLFEVFCLLVVGVVDYLVELVLGLEDGRRFLENLFLIASPFLGGVLACSQAAQCHQGEEHHVGKAV